ncbi:MULTISPECIES: hypothetical protein [Saccharopolyspora]|uniref:Uncharacterized protein n=1 Tax=Saccharopolyspora gregorii TaxID=33914 RepID=A0ABP6RXU6_9PSEU|nr:MULTISPECIES: hypothetical protein [Saccharopolyspora]MCA1188144.1 hypothetical protein [Saccharopolyspora sp. 6T]MCA1195242.1 hypothetical protein [Saccharopolyspora sp. 6V]MCA1227081.1 hypothetical protein [Saccharopolyspora sp. 6M]MCA1282679.1 hypothetical protein [Saccharopolyspora sp. 7B]
MANNAHFITANSGGPPVVVVRDDRGSPVTELELPAGDARIERADAELGAAGWTREVEWTAADDGWVVPVVPA